MLAPHRKSLRQRPDARTTGSQPHGENWNHEAAMKTDLSLLHAHINFKEEIVQYNVTELSEVSDAGVLLALTQFVEDQFARVEFDSTLPFTAPVNRADDDEDFDEDFDDED